MLDGTVRLGRGGHVHRAVDEGVEAPDPRQVTAVAAPARDPQRSSGERTLNVRTHTGRRGRRRGGPQSSDLEHWAAFGHSFERLATASRPSRAASTAGRRRAPWSSRATSTTLPAEVVRPEGSPRGCYQLTVSPLHNQAPHPDPGGLPIGGAPGRGGSPSGSPAWRGPSRAAGVGELAGPTSATRSANWCHRREARFLLSVSELGATELSRSSTSRWPGPDGWVR